MTRRVLPGFPSGEHTLNATGHTHTIKDGSFRCDECADAIDRLNDESPDFRSLGIFTDGAAEEELEINIGRSKSKK